MANDLKGRCGKCDHVFVVAHLPMRLSLAAKLAQHAACPRCGSAKPIYVATESWMGAGE